MSRQNNGRTMSVLVMTSAPAAPTDGSDLTLLADKTESWKASWTIASKLQLKLLLSGTVTASNYTLYVMDAANQWWIAAETGNLGVISGGPLSPPLAAQFPINDIGAYKRVAIFQGTAGATAVASLEEVVEEDRKGP